MATRNTTKVLGTVLALGAATGAIVFGSFAAWTATTRNDDNKVTTGTLSFNNTTPTAKISATDIKPDDTVSSTTYTIENPANGVDFAGVTLKAENAVFSNTHIGEDLQLRIKVDGTQVWPSTAGQWESWDEASSGGALATGIATGAWADGVTKNFVVEWRLPTTTDNDTQSESAEFDLVWTGQQ